MLFKQPPREIRGSSGAESGFQKPNGTGRKRYVNRAAEQSYCVMLEEALAKIKEQLLFIRIKDGQTG